MKIFDKHSTHISVEDIQNYLNDLMSSAEKQKFEAHLLSCELCNEAFDGYQENSHVQIDEILPDLKNRLSQRVQPPKRIRWSIAASIALILSVSIVFLFNYLGEEQDQVTVNEKKETKADKELTPTNQEDTSGSQQEIERVENILENQPDENLVEERDLEIKSEEKIKPKTKEVEIEPVPIPVDQSKGEEKHLFTITESIEDEGPIGNQGAGFIAPIEESERTEEEEVLGELDMGSADEDFGSDETDAAFYSDQENFFSVTEEKTEESSSKRSKKREGEKAAFSTSRRQSAASSTSSNRRIAPTRQNAVPQIGYELYNVYLKDSLKYPINARQAGIQGEVELQFTVDETGQINNLKTIRSLSPECDTEAIRLVITGPKWTLINKSLSDDNNVVNLIIMFDLTD